MMIFNVAERIIIVTYDLTLSRTYTHRYFSFINALKNENHQVKGIGIDFPFNPHPINSIEKSQDADPYSTDILTIKLKKLNFVQKLLVYSDKKAFPFYIKKLLLALHIVLYRTDQWIVDEDDFAEVDHFRPTIVISGGSTGIMGSAYSLAQRYHAKFIIDYRDPLNFGYHLLETNPFASKFKRLFTLSKERKLLAAADHIITVSDSLKSFFPEEFKSKVTIIENGSNFVQQEVIEHIVERPKIFNIIYLGTLYNEQLEDMSFFIALKSFISANHLEANSLKLLFLGSSQNKLLLGIIHKFQLQHFTEVTNRLNNSQLSSHLLNASMFLQLRYGDRSQIITSKNADYLMFRKPILLPNSDHGDIEKSIQDNQAGYICDGNIECIQEALQCEYDKHIRKESVILSQKDLSSLTRAEVAKKIYQIIP